MVQSDAILDTVMSALRPRWIGLLFSERYGNNDVFMTEMDVPRPREVSRHGPI